LPQFKIQDSHSSFPYYWNDVMYVESSTTVNLTLSKHNGLLLTSTHESILIDSEFILMVMDDELKIPIILCHITESNF